MIQDFPHFSKLTLSNRDEVVRFTSRFEPYSDFNFTSLFAWSVDDTTEASWLNGNLVVRMPDYLDGHLVYSILGDNDMDSSIAILLQEMPSITLIPEVVVESIQNKDKFIITEDRDNFDYVYSLAQLSDLPGNHFKKKRNKVNVFTRDHATYELMVEAATDMSREEIEEIKMIDQEWVKHSSRSGDDTMPERKALARLLESFSELNLLIVKIIVNGEIKAFSINEALDNDYAICHFEKALVVHHDHIYTFVAREVARILHNQGCRWVNWEQDVGIEGLRRSKLSYHPIKMLKKYTVKLAGN